MCAGFLPVQLFISPRQHLHTPGRTVRWLQQGLQRGIAGIVQMISALPFLEAAVRLTGWRLLLPLSYVLERAQFSKCR